MCNIWLGIFLVRHNLWSDPSCSLSVECSKRPSLERIFVLDTKTISTPSHTSKVNVVQHTSSHQIGGNNKNKGKLLDPRNIVTNRILQRLLILNWMKAKFPCMIYEEDHYMKYFLIMRMSLNVLRVYPKWFSTNLWLHKILPLCNGATQVIPTTRMLHRVSMRCTCLMRLM